MKDNRYEWRMYSLVMYNISSMQKGVQTVHSCLDYANTYKDSESLKQYIQEDKTLIILDGGTSSDLTGLLYMLGENKIEFGRFIEPDLNYSVTSVCFLADEKVWDRKNYPDYEDWLGICGKSVIFLMSNPSQPLVESESYQEWLQFIGGEKNLFLRELIKNKRLSM